MKWYPIEDWDIRKVWASPELPGWRIEPRFAHRWGSEAFMGWMIVRPDGSESWAPGSTLKEAKAAAVGLAQEEQ